MAHVTYAEGGSDRGYGRLAVRYIAYRYRLVSFPDLCTDLGTSLAIHAMLLSLVPKQPYLAHENHNANTQPTFMITLHPLSEFSNA